MKVPPGGIYLDNELLQSPAFKAIKSANSFRVLMEFYRRRKIFKPKNPKGKRTEPIIINNGQIVLPYRDAIKRLGISQTTYSRCLTELVELGFLDVEKLSCGLHRQPTMWSISARWKKYGQADFVPVKRERIKPPFAQKRKSQLSQAGNSKGQIVTADGQ